MHRHGRVSDGEHIAAGAALVRVDDDAHSAADEATTVLSAASAAAASPVAAPAAVSASPVREDDFVATDSFDTEAVEEVRRRSAAAADVATWLGSASAAAAAATVQNDESAVVVSIAAPPPVDPPSAVLAGTSRTLFALAPLRPHSAAQRLRGHPPSQVDAAQLLHAALWQSAASSDDATATAAPAVPLPEKAEDGSAAVDAAPAAPSSPSPASPSLDASTSPALEPSSAPSAPDNVSPSVAQRRINVQPASPSIAKAQRTVKKRAAAPAAPLLVPLQPHELAKPVAARPPGVPAPLQRADSFSMDMAPRLGASPGPASASLAGVVPSPVSGALDGASLAKFDAAPSSAMLGLLSLDRTVLQDDSGGLTAGGPDSFPSDDSTSSSSFHRCGLLGSFTSRIIQPESRFLSYWRLLVLFFTLYNASIIPYRLAFEGSGGSHKARSSLVSIFTLDYIGDIVFLADMFVQSRTAFLQNGMKQSSPRAVWNRYKQSWFILDLLASLPFDLLQLIPPMRVLPVVRISKLLRLAKVRMLSAPLSDSSHIFAVLQAPLIVLFVSHVVGCIYFGICRLEGFAEGELHENWAINTELGGSEDKAYQYLHSLYWSYALLTDRDHFGHTPHTPLQYLFTFASMMLGVIGLAWIIGSVAASIDAANEGSNEFAAQLSFIDRFMSCYEIPKQLQNQVASYYDYLWSSRNGGGYHTSEGAGGSAGGGMDLPAVLAELPDVLTTDISMHLLFDVVCRVELFAGVDGSFVPALIRKMHPSVYLPGDMVCTYGDYGDSMYFIQQGEVDIIKGRPSSMAGEDDEVVLSTLKPGDHFGEYSLLLPTARTASARAVGFCTIYVLRREPFEQIMRIFTKSASVIRSRAKKHHAAAIKREEERLKAVAGAANGGIGGAAASSSDEQAAGNDDASSSAATADAVPSPPSDPVRILLVSKQNAKEYRKKISVYAFRVDSPVTVNKSWGTSSCQAGDWFVIGGESDAYTVGNDLFQASYEAIPQGALHTYRKKGTVLAAQASRPFSVRSAPTKSHPEGEILPGQAGDFLVQDEKLNQYFVPGPTFLATYEQCADKVEDPTGGKGKKKNILDANSAAIRALKQRSDTAKDALAHVPGVILPSSRAWRVWDLLVSLVILYNAIVIPLRISFLPGSKHGAFLFFDYLGDALLLADIAAHFRLAFVRDGSLITDRSAISARYKGGAFLFDLVACLPLDVFMLVTGMQPLFRLGRLLKVYSFHQVMDNLIRTSSGSSGGSVSSALKLGRLLVAFMLLSHWISCIYFLFTRWEHYGDEIHFHWLPSEELKHEGITAQYLRSQYFSFVVLTGFCGLVVPNTSAEVIFSILSIMIGVLVVSILIGEIASVVSNLEPFQGEHEKRVGAVESFMRSAKLPSGLQERVRRYLAHEWSVQRGADPNKALAALPPMLRLQTKMEMCGDAIRRTPFFNRAADATLLAIVSALTFETYPGGEHIFVQGQIGDKVFIINQGLVSIQLTAANKNEAPVAAANGAVDATATGALSASASPSPPVIIKTLGKGSFFGEGALLRSGRRSASALAVRGGADLLVVSKKDFLRIVSDDPEFGTVMQSIVETRLQGIQRKRREMASAAQTAMAITTERLRTGLLSVQAGSNGNTAAVADGIPRRQSMFAHSSTAAQLSSVRDVKPPVARQTRGYSAALGTGSSVQLTSAKGGLGALGSVGEHQSASTGSVNANRPPLRSFTLMTTQRDHKGVQLQRQAMQAQAGLPASSAQADDSSDDDEHSASNADAVGL